MNTIMNIVVLAAGFTILIKAAEKFVDASSAIAAYFKIPPLIIGLTVVAMGTSAPEFAVSLTASLKGSSEIALSNVLGSNIFNFLGVLGVCALIKPLPVDKSATRRDFPILIGAGLFALLGACGLSLVPKLMQESTANAGTVTRAMGIVMVACFVGYLALLIREAKKNPAEDIKESLNGLEHVANAAQNSLLKDVIISVLSLACIVGGGQAVVYGAKNVALAFGMSETLIGLTIVSIGTSLPELVTSLIAANKGENGIAFGNAAGSNVFNMLLILGSAALANPIMVNTASAQDLCIMLGATVLTAAFSVSHKGIVRWEGAVMIAAYIGTVVFAALR